MKIVINGEYGGYSVSEKALTRINILKLQKGKPQVEDDSELSRDDPELVQVVEELGQDANGFVAVLKIVEIPDNVEWVIEEYDGKEWVAEKHRTWG